MRRANEIHIFQLLEPLLSITAPSVVLSAKQKIRFYSRYRNSRYLDKKFETSRFRHNHSRISIITLSQIIRKAYNIFVLYFAQTFVCVGVCVCACVFILLSSFIIYWEPSVTYVRESLTITYHTRRVVPFVNDLRGSCGSLFFFFLFFSCFLVFYLLNEFNFFFVINGAWKNVYKSRTLLRMIESFRIMSLVHLRLVVYRYAILSYQIGWW